MDYYTLKRRYDNRRQRLIYAQDNNTAFSTTLNCQKTNQYTVVLAIFSIQTQT